MPHPTEHAVGLAAAQLLDALPRGTRQALDGLLPAIRTLRARAEAERARADQLAGRIAEVEGGPFEASPDTAHGRAAARDALHAARAAAEVAHARTVAVLEALRLDLLRLHAAPTDGVLAAALLARAARAAEAHHTEGDSGGDAAQASQSGGPRNGASAYASSTS